MSEEIYRARRFPVNPGFLHSRGDRYEDRAAYDYDRFHPVMVIHYDIIDDMHTRKYPTISLRRLL
jgi:hypothetical protein